MTIYRYGEGFARHVLRRPGKRKQAGAAHHLQKIALYRTRTKRPTRSVVFGSTAGASVRSTFLARSRRFFLTCTDAYDYNGASFQELFGHKDVQYVEVFVIQEME